MSDDAACDAEDEDEEKNPTRQALQPRAAALALGPRFITRCDDGCS